MKKYTLSITGDVSVNSFGNIDVSDINILLKLIEKIGVNIKDAQYLGSKKFPGKVEITITDFTEPLKIEEVGTEDES